MADYSSTPLHRKLGIGAGANVAFVNAPPDFAAALGLLPDGVTMVAAGEPADVAVLFVTTLDGLLAHFGALQAAMRPGGGLWVAWPKKSAKVATELTFESVQPFGLGAGLVDNKVCAIDATWTALRFVRRRVVAGRAKG